MRQALVNVPLLVVLYGACASAPARVAAPAPTSLHADRRMLSIPAGTYKSGSDPVERERAYTAWRDAAGFDGARKNRWFDREEAVKERYLDAFLFDETLVSNAAYAEFVADTGTRPPSISAAAWKAQGFSQDYEKHVKPHNWLGQSPPPGREQHPVVLVTWHEAEQYCRWRGRLRGQARFLPTEHQFERVARGPGDSAYPWGEQFDATRLNSRAMGPADTTAVRAYPSGRSKLGAYDMAGNVFQWTSSRWNPKRMTVKGSAWDDYPGLGRAASRHGRPAGIRHVIVGFRCAGEAKAAAEMPSAR